MREKSVAKIHHQIAQELGVRDEQVEAAVTLLDGGATVPFIARYRKELTGALEIERAAKRIGASLEAAPTVYVSDTDLLGALDGDDDRQTVGLGPTDPSTTTTTDRPTTTRRSRRAARRSRADCGRSHGRGRRSRPDDARRRRPLG